MSPETIRRFEVAAYHSAVAMSLVLVAALVHWPLIAVAGCVGVAISAASMVRALWQGAREMED